MAVVEPCAGCGLALPGGTEGCQATFDEESARAYADVWFASRRRVIVDAYCLQHPDRYCSSAIALAAHLTGLCVAIEHPRRELGLNTAVQRWLSSRPSIVKPPLPARRGAVTIADIRAADDPVAHQEVVGRWARDVWDAYVDLHLVARTWINAAAAP